MDENPYEAPVEPPISTPESQRRRVTAPWRVGRPLFLLGVFLSAPCLVAVLIWDPRIKSSWGPIAALFSAGLAFGVAAIIAGAFLLLLGDVFAQQPASQDRSRRPQIGNWFSVATLLMCIAAVAATLLVPACYAVGNSADSNWVFRREMAISVTNAICVVAAGMLLIHAVGRWRR